MRSSKLCEFLKTGTFHDLGFYTYLRSRVKVGQLFRCCELGEELYLHSVTIYNRLQRLEKQGAIAFVGTNKGCKITAFNL